MIFCSVSLFSVVAILFSDVVDEKQKPVGDIHLADTAVKVQRYYIYLRIQRLQPIFDDLLHCSTSEGNQLDFKPITSVLSQKIAIFAVANPQWASRHIERSVFALFLSLKLRQLQ